MKRNVWLAVIPLLVVCLGLAGGRNLPDGGTIPSEVTYSKINSITLDLGNYVCVVFHEPSSVNVLPLERKRDMPDLKETSFMNGGVSDMDQAVLSMMLDTADEEINEMDKTRKKKSRSIMGQSDGKADFDDRASGKGPSPFKKDVEEGWGGWLSDTILSEEKRVQKEINSQLMEEQAESVLRGGFEFEPASQIGSGGKVDRLGSAGEIKDGKLTPFKPAFRIESWKPKGK